MAAIPSPTGSPPGTLKRDKDSKKGWMGTLTRGKKKKEGKPRSDR